MADLVGVAVRMLVLGRVAESACPQVMHIRQVHPAVTARKTLPALGRAAGDGADLVQVAAACRGRAGPRRRWRAKRRLPSTLMSTSLLSGRRGWPPLPGLPDRGEDVIEMAERRGVPSWHEHGATVRNGSRNAAGQSCGRANIPVAMPQVNLRRDLVQGEGPGPCVQR